MEEVVGEDEEVSENGCNDEDGDKQVRFGCLTVGVLFVLLILRIMEGHAKTAVEIERRIQGM